MPEFSVKEVRLPELHLPEIKRDEIVRSLAGVRLPEVDLARARQARIKIPAVTLTSSDVGKLLAAGAALARFARPAPRRGRWLSGAIGRRSPSPVARFIQPRPSRSRRPLVLGAFVVAVFGAVVLLRRPAVRQRVDDAARRVRIRFDELRAGSYPQDAADEPIAFTAAQTAPIEAQGFASSTDGVDTVDTASDYPEGLGSNATATDDTLAFEETGKPG